MRNLLWLIFSLILIIADRLLKDLVSDALSLHEIIPITSFLNITLAYNTGAAFSFLNDAGGWQQYLFTGVAIIVSSIMVIWLYRLPSSDHFTASALALIIGGALGNLWDRLIFGHVIDFIDFYILTWHFAAFNLADAAICLGAAILILTSFRKDSTPTTKNL
ncbi:MAG: signal peptidase II [Gammaproteobacteria bacterium]